MQAPEPYKALADQADALIASGDPVRAIVCLKEALKLKPTYFRGWIQLSRLLYEQKHYAEAVKVVRAAEQFDPLRAEFQSVQRCLQARDFHRARLLAQDMQVKQHGHPRAVFTLAHIAQLQGDHEGRAAILRDGLSHSPANLVLRMMLFSALEEAGDFAQAIETAEHIAEIEETFETVWTLTSIQFRYGQNEAALLGCDRSEKLCQSDPAKLSDINLIRAQVYRILGRKDDSLSAFRASLANNSDNAAAWWGLADLKTYAFSDDDKMAIRALLRRADLDPEQRSMAAFALAKASETQGDWKATMALYKQANALRCDIQFNSDGFLKAADRLVEAVTPAAVERQAVSDPSDPIPIFILGMPRSGSTLIEQILASHSQIEGTMEQPVLPGIKRKAHRICAQHLGGSYLSQLARIGASDLTELGNAYLDQGALFREGQTKFFTDKLPYNFEHVALIHKILPRALIIDARRNPLDCGFSLFKQYFAKGSDFSYALEHIGAFYNGYLKLMDHWDAVLPGKVLHVQYEDLVQDPEAQIRRILEHVGVSFEPACLNFHETDRAIRTASSEQVRQPLNRRGIGAWRQVSAELEPLRQSLGEATLKRFEPYISD
ncbi:MAG: sulfotransferase [Henriciella sp.]|nr:sulfotransferase [Henriciella sp.]